MSVRTVKSGDITMPRKVFIRRLLFVALAVNLSFLVLAGLLLYQSRLRYEDRAGISTRNLANAFAGQIQADIDQIDLAVGAVADETERQIATGKINETELNAFIARHRSRVPALDGMRVVNASGENVYGTEITPGDHTSVADRAYFQQLRSDTNSELVISEPLVGRVSKKRSIVLARRINAPDGTFAGVAYGTIALDHFKTLFSSVNLGTHGAVTVRNDQLALIYRYPEPTNFDEVAGQNNSSPEQFAAIQKNTNDGTYHSRLSFDHVNRTYTYSRVPHHPMYVIVGLTPGDYLKAWRNETSWTLALAILFTLASVIATWIVYRDWEHSTVQVHALAEQKEALQQSEDRYRRLVEDSTDTIYIERDGKIIFINPAGLRLLGASSPDQVLEKSSADFIHPDYRETAGRLPGSNGAVSHTGKYLRLDGKSVDVEATTIPLVYDQKPAVQVILHDITERNRLEAQLRQAQKLEALGTLAGGTAHEFNNMLGIIMGNCDLLRMDLAGNRSVQTELDEIMNAGRRAREIVQQVLAFSRLQREARHFIYLHEAVQDAADRIRKVIPQTVEIQTQIEPGLPILGNVTQIHQVVMNICVNAWHALPESRGAIKIFLRSVMLDKAAPGLNPALRAGPYLKLSISDNGSGIEKELLGRIFEPFFTTKGVGKGSGLGLAVVHGIVQTHEGAVVVSSEPGSGTVFDLYFPARPDAQVQPVPLSKDPSPPGKGQHILVVDDEPSLTRVTAKSLVRLGYRSTEVHSGADALESVRRQPGQFDLVITDLTMPEMSGIALARTLHASHPNLPVILASGFDVERTSETDYPPNIRARLQKPYSAEVLAEALHGVFNGCDGSNGSEKEQPFP